jgi:hypothetical protein
VVEHLTHHS